MPRPLLGNRDFSRALNRSTVLNMIKTVGPIDRAELARRTGLSAATVTGITAELISDDLVFEKAPGNSRGGRRPILLALNARGSFVVGLKVTETQVIGALTDLEATVLEKRSDTLLDRTPEHVIETLVASVHALIQSQNIELSKLLGVGVGLAGIIDTERGVLRQSPFFGWHDLPLRQLLHKKLNVPVYIDNDVNTLTLTEKWFGSGYAVDNFLTVTIGRGVGLGIVVNGQFYRGASGGAGEFGHTVIEPNGPLCDCGKRGCLEAFVGDPGLLRMAAESMTNAPATSEQLLAAANQGDPLARAVFARAGEVLGRGIANLINIFNPSHVLISGEGVRVGEWLFPAMRQAIQLHVMPGLVGDTAIRIDTWGDDAWARGAAGLVLRELFESPVNRI